MKDATKMDIFNEAHFLTQPIRIAILKQLEKNPDGMYLSELEGIIKKDRRHLSFHLITLKERGYVTGELEISKKSKSKGRAASRFKLTPKMNEILGELKAILY